MTKDETYVFSDEEYGKVLDNFVIACVDVAVIHDNKILLERREFDPVKGHWWIFGGRIKVGEDLQTAAQRGVYRELDLNIQKQRFEEIGVFNLIWPVRREPVTSHGCHHLLIAHMVDINDEEFVTVNEHVRVRGMDAAWFELDDLSGLQLLPEMDSVIMSVRQALVNDKNSHLAMTER